MIFFFFKLEKKKKKKEWIMLGCKLKKQFLKLCMVVINVDKVNCMFLELYFEVF